MATTMLTISQIKAVVKRARKRAKAKTWPKFNLTMAQVEANIERYHDAKRRAGK